MRTASAGVDTVNGKDADVPALSVAKDRKISMDMHRTTRIEDFVPQDGDLFVAMEPYQASALKKRDWGVSHQVTLLGLWVEAKRPVILDPFGQDDRVYAECFSLIESGVGRMMKMMVR